MPFERVMNPSYPCVYESWSTETASWVVQDLRPEDDEEAVEILIDNLCRDETLCSIQGLCVEVIEDPASLDDLRKLWRESLQQRMSLGCYELRGGCRTLVALNVCVAGTNEEHDLEFKGEKWKNVYDVLQHLQKKVDVHKLMGLELVLHALGLVVKREYRGAKLGGRLLAAREPLCKGQGVKGTATIFTRVAAQKLAASCGFETIAEVTLRELATLGLPYPRDDLRVMKYMVNKYE